MTNNQVAAARKVLLKYPLLKVTIGRVDAGETLIPYEAADVFNRGAETIVTGNTPPAQIERDFNAACLSLMESMAA